VLTILGETNVDLDPFDRVGDRKLQGSSGVFRRRAHGAAMGHDLKSPRRTDRLEEREPRGSGPAVIPAGKE
jgi:hypothetical protein